MEFVVIFMLIGLCAMAIIVSHVTGIPILRSHSHNKELTRFISERLESGIKTCKAGNYNATVEFNDGYTAVFWIANKMYAYCSSGKVIRPDGTTFGWNDEMPSRVMNYKLLKEVNKNIYK